MTAGELKEILAKYPDHAIVECVDRDCECNMPVSGIMQVREGRILIYAAAQSDDQYDSDHEYKYDDDDGCCERCDGEGIIVTCFDDICVGSGHCIHGDGEEVCPDCGGQ